MMTNRISRFAGLAAVIGLTIALLMTTSGADVVDDPTTAPAAATNPTTAPALVVPTKPFRGVVIQVQTLIDLAPYEKAVDEIADLGADTILIGTQVQEENGESTQIAMDIRTTPSWEKLGEFIDYIKARHLRVVLVPTLVLTSPHGSEWRGSIRPTSWSEWFVSYRGVIDMYADIAQSHHVDLLSVGTELTTAEEHVDEWARTIDSVRDRFSGSLTYSANWDHYANIPFWDQLDVIALNCYYKLGDGPDVTLDQIKENWTPIHDTLVSFANDKKKPLIFTEVGWCSMTNAATTAWDYTQTDLPTDNALQERLWRGFLETWYGDPALAGFMVQEWSPGPPAEKGYTPEGKPAEKVLRTYLAKSPWKIRVAG